MQLLWDERTLPAIWSMFSNKRTPHPIAFFVFNYGIGCHYCDSLFLAGPTTSRIGMTLFIIGLDQGAFPQRRPSQPASLSQKGIHPRKELVARQW